MAKKKKKEKKPTTPKIEEKTEVLDKKERKNMEYTFVAIFAASIVFLLVYLIGFILALLKII